MKWHRTDYGYFSDDRSFFLERGARMTHGSNAWLIWRRTSVDELRDAAGGVYEWATGHYARSESELFYVGEPSEFPGGNWYLHVADDGWLADAKLTAERWAEEDRVEQAQLADPTFLNRTCKYCGTHWHDSGSGERTCPKCGWKAWYAGPSVTINPPPDLPLLRARVGVRQEDNEASVRAFDTLAKDYGYEAASAAWQQACQEMDADADRIEEEAEARSRGLSVRELRERS